METNKEEKSNTKKTKEAVKKAMDLKQAGVILAMALDVTNLVNYDAPVAYTFTGKEDAAYAVPFCDIDDHSAGGPFALSGKALRTLVTQRMATLRPELRPGALSQSAVLYDMLEALCGVSATDVNEKARFSRDVTVFREWSGADDSEKSDAEGASGHPFVKIDEDGVEYSVLRPTGRVIGYALEKSAFTKVVRLFTPANVMKVNIATVKGLKRVKKVLSVVEYIAFDDVIEFIARCGIRTVSADIANGGMIMMTVPADIARASPELYKLAKADVQELNVEFLSGVNGFMGGNTLPPTTSAARAVMTGAYFKELLDQAGRDGLARGATTVGKLAAKGASLEK